MEKLFIFDFDGTIADTKSIVRRGLLDYSKENSLPTPNVDLICNYYANPDSYDFGWGVDKEKQKYLMDKAFIEITEKITDGTYIPELFGEAKKIIEKLYDDGYTLSICTSREKRACDRVLSHYGLEKYFKTMKTRDDVTERKKKPKPNPDLILEIIDELGFKKENSFIIGDTDGDIYGGKNAKINTIAVDWGYFTKEELEKLNPNYIIDKFEDFLSIL